jgi:hypothetical protein
LSKVRVIEEVEELRAELDAHAFSDLRVLDHREVGVIEGWSSDRIPAQAAKVENVLPASPTHNWQCKD